MAANSGTTISVVLDKVPIAGNALIAVHFTGATSSNGVTSSGYGSPVLTFTNTPSLDEGKAHVKIAGSSESQTVTATPGASENNMLIVIEVEGPFTSSSQVDIAQFQAVASGTSFAIDVGTPSQAIELAIAVLMMRSPEEYGLNVWTNGFHQYGMTVSSAEKSLCLAVKETNSIGNIDTTVTMYPNTTVMGGMITLKAHADVVAPPNPGVGYWTELATPAASRALANVNPDPTNVADYKGSNGQESVTDSWNGAIVRQPAAGGILEYIIEAAGGHDNYFGNEGYTLDLLAGTIAWIRHRDPTVATADLSLNDSDGVDATGKALARHTYNYQCYDWDNDEFVFFGGNSLAGGSAVGSSHVLRLQYGTNKTTWITTGIANVPGFGGSEGAWHAWYIGDNEFIVVPGGGNGFAKYIKGSNTYVSSTTSGLLGSMPYGCSLWDSKRGRMVLFGYHASEVILLNPIVGGAAEQATISVPGALDFSDDGIGGVYDSYLDRYVFWQGGEDLYILDPVAWTWTTRSLSTQTVTPTAPNANGTYNRFAYVRPTDNYPEGAYIIVNATTESTYLFYVPAEELEEITADAISNFEAESVSTVTNSVSATAISDFEAEAVCAVSNAVSISAASDFESESTASATVANSASGTSNFETESLVSATVGLSASYSSDFEAESLVVATVAEAASVVSDFEAESLAQVQTNQSALTNSDFETESAFVVTLTIDGNAVSDLELESAIAVVSDIISNAVSNFEAESVSVVTVEELSTSLGISNRFDRQIKAAIKLIAKNGQKVIWRVISDVPDVNKPWESTSQVLESHVVSICFLPANKQTLESLVFIPGTEVPKGCVLGYMGATSFEPNLKDVVIRNGVKLSIFYIDKLSPNGQNLLYTLLLKE